jgi:hypothetical protein
LYPPLLHRTVHPVITAVLWTSQNVSCMCNYI